MNSYFLSFVCLAGICFCLKSGAEVQLSNPIVGKKFRLEKTPKSLFLIKKAKIDVNAGEPQFYPIEAQLRMISNEPILQNTNRFK